MLEVIRRNAQNWGVKLLFGVIVLVFVFWGVGSFQGQEKTVLATMDGEQIRMRDFQKRYQRRLQSLREQRDDLDRSALREMGLKRQVFNQMVQRKLLLDKAQKWGLILPSSQLRKRIEQMEVFQDANQTFDSRRYRRVLSASRMSPAEFEAGLRQDAMAQKIMDLLAGASQVGEIDAKGLFDYLNLQSRVRYLAFRAKDHLDQVEVSQEQIRQYYQDNRDEFRKPARMRMRYLLLTPEALARYQEVSDEELRRYYQRNKQDYEGEEQVRARQILFRLGENATAEKVREEKEKLLRLQEKIAQGEMDFAEAARQHSQGSAASQGGSLGWVGKGEALPSWEEAAFSLEPGKMSDPVRSSRGLHLIRVEERREAGVKPFSQVKEQVREQVARDRAAGGVEDNLDAVLEAVFEGMGLEQAVEKVGLKTRQSDWFSRGKGPEELDLGQDQLGKLFQLEQGQVTLEPILLEDGYLLAEKLEQKESRVLKLEEVRQAIVRQLRRQKANAAAQKSAERALEELRASEEVPRELRDRMQESDPMGRQGEIQGLGKNQNLARDAFTTPKGKWLPQTYSFENTHVVAQVQEMISPSREVWNKQKSFWLSRLSSTRKQELLGAMIQTMRSRAEIEVKQPEALEY